MTWRQTPLAGCGGPAQPSTSDPPAAHACLQVSARIEELLHTAFENYFMLSEETASGMMDGALAVRSGIPAVLRPAVQLFGEGRRRRRWRWARHALQLLPGHLWQPGWIQAARHVPA